MVTRRPLRRFSRPIIPIINKRMKRVVDFHTHILPCMDDGSTDAATSLKMLRAEVMHGVGTVVLTPHFYPDKERPEDFLKRREASLVLLEKAMEEGEESFPKLLVGAEVRYFEGMSDCEYLSKLAISQTNLIMIEMPFVKWNKRMLSELSEINEKQGLIPIIAHIDRYIGVFHPCVCFDDLACLPVLIQMGTDFFVRRSTRKRAIKTFKRGIVHLFGTDAHNMGSRRPNMDKAVEILTRTLGDGAIEYINSIENDILNSKQGEI